MVFGTKFGAVQEGQKVSNRGPADPSWPYILYYKKWVKLFYKVNLAAFYQFLSDPGVPGVRSMGPDV